MDMNLAVFCFLWILCCVTVTVSKKAVHCLYEEFHDRTNPRRVQLHCEGHEMITVQRAFLARAYVPLTTAADWCSAPYHNEEHCIDHEASLTTEFRESCNTRSVCTRRLYYTVPQTCGQPEFNPGTVSRLYIHVEYQCISRYDAYNPDQQIPFTQICPTTVQAASGSVLHLMSLDYPAQQRTESFCTCLISIPIHARGTIKFRDMNYTSSSVPSPCLVRFDIPGELRCADPQTIAYSDFTLDSHQYEEYDGHFQVHLTLKTAEAVINQRLWLEVSAIDSANDPVPGMRVSCRGDAHEFPHTGLGVFPPTTVSGSRGNNTQEESQEPFSSDKDNTLYAVIGGSIVGLFVIIFLVILVICIKRRQRKSAPKDQDLAYICHANVAATKRLGIEENTYTDTIHRPFINFIQPHALSGGPWPGKSSDEADTTAMQNVYSDIGDTRYNRMSEGSGQYATLDANAPQPYTFKSYAAVEASPSGPPPEEPEVFVPRPVRPPAPVYERQLPTSSAPNITSDNVYAKPDKTRKVPLTSQTSSNYSETQMFENDVYNRL